MSKEIDFVALVNNLPELEIFYEASCPFCARVASWLKSKDPTGRLEFTDISAPDGDIILCLYKIDPAEAHKIPHGMDEIGTVFSGWDLALKTFEVLEYKKLHRLLSLPVVKQLGCLGFWVIRKVI